jgi:hypothetical protein
MTLITAFAYQKMYISQSTQIYGVAQVCHLIILSAPRCA